MDMISALYEGWDNMDLNNPSLVWDFIYNYYHVLYPNEGDDLVRMEEIFKQWMKYKALSNTHRWCCSTKRWLPSRL